MRILVAEDDKSSAIILMKLLSSYGEIEHVVDGEEAYDRYCDAYFHGNPFELVILDIMMPRLTGQEALISIREFEEEQGLSQTEGVKVIMATALGDSMNLYHAHAAGCLDYLVKPVRKDKLTLALGRLGIERETNIPSS